MTPSLSAALQSEFHAQTQDKKYYGSALNPNFRIALRAPIPLCIGPSDRPHPTKNFRGDQGKTYFFLFCPVGQRRIPCKQFSVSLRLTLPFDVSPSVTKVVILPIIRFFRFLFPAVGGNLNWNLNILLVVWNTSLT